MPRIRAICAICVSLLLLTPVQASHSLAWSVEVQFKPGTVLVGVRPSESLAKTARLLADHGLQVESDLTPLPVVSVNVPTGQEMATVESLRRTGQVAFAELDYRAHATEVITPNDPGWSSQWGPAKIQAPAAWSLVTGTQVIIAVVDSGIQLSHEDLASQVWTNPGEIPGNGLDDDSNGKVDDVHGWHFYPMWTGTAFVPSENANVQDDYGHGTHVAGIAAAETNNGVGIAGVAWGARVMPVKVLDEYGTGWYSDIALGIAYAANNGAKIINLSLGGSSASDTLCAAAEYAHGKGAWVVAAAGNSGGAVYYPAACDHVLGVASTDQSDQRASTSNHGSQVDVAAPGTDIYSTWCHQNIYLKLCDGNYYVTKSGTSMAAPHVSGVAALIWSRWPALTADAVALQITRTTVDVDSPGWDEYTGWGRVNAAGAITTLTTPADLWIHVAAPARAGPGQVITYVLQYGNGGGDARDAWITVTLPVNLTATTPLTHHEPILAAASGPYTLTLAAIVGPDVSPGVELTCTATITAMDMDLNSLDNTTQAVTRVGYLAFLPVALKE